MREGGFFATRLKRLSLQRRGKAVAHAIKRLSLPRRAKQAAKRAASLVRRMSLPRRGRKIAKQAASMYRRASVPRRVRWVAARAKSVALRGLVLGWSYVPASMREAVEDLVQGIINLISALQPVFATLQWSTLKLAVFIRLLLAASAHIPLLLSSLIALLPSSRVRVRIGGGWQTQHLSKWLLQLPSHVVSLMATSLANKLWPSMRYGAAAAAAMGAFASAMVVVQHNPASLVAVATILVLLYALPTIVMYIGGRITRHVVARMLQTATKQLDVALKSTGLLNNIDLNASPWPLFRHHLTLPQTFNL